MWRLGGETNAIKVNQQPELIEIKDQKRGGGREGMVLLSQEPRRSGKTQPEDGYFFMAAACRTAKIIRQFGLKTILLFISLVMAENKLKQGV